MIMRHLDHHRRSLWAIALLGGLALSGCDQPQDDIDAFLKNPGVGAKKIDKIPTTKAFPGVQYFRDQVRDPFVANLAMGAPIQAEPPVRDEDREPLEQFPLENLAMTGMVNIDGKTYALIRDPESQVHRVTMGQRLGQNYGKVIQVSRAGVQLEELVQDGAGAWATVPAKIPYQESNQLSRARK